MKGFTLFEMMIAVSILAVIVMGGTVVFYRTLSSSGTNQAQIDVTSSSNQVLQAIENNIRFKKVLAVSGVDRATCQATSGFSVSGSTLSVYDDYCSTVYSLTEDNKVASSSSPVCSGGMGVVDISSPDLKVNDLQFVWTCNPGANDAIKVTIVTNDVDSATSPDHAFSRDINMYNSF